MLVKLEQQIAELIELIAKVNEKVDHLDKKFESRFEKLERRFETEQKLNQARFDELLKEIRNQNFILNHHRGKIYKNEEDIAVFKQIIQS